MKYSHLLSFSMLAITLTMSGCSSSLEGGELEEVVAGSVSSEEGVSGNSENPGGSGSNPIASSGVISSEVGSDITNSSNSDNSEKEVSSEANNVSEETKSSQKEDQGTSSDKLSSEVASSVKVGSSSSAIVSNIPDKNCTTVNSTDMGASAPAYHTNGLHGEVNCLIIRPIAVKEWGYTGIRISVANDVGDLSGGTLTIKGSGGYNATHSVGTHAGSHDFWIPKTHASGQEDANTYYIVKYHPVASNEIKFAWYRGTSIGSESTSFSSGTKTYGTNISCSASNSHNLGASSPAYWAVGSSALSSCFQIEPIAVNNWAYDRIVVQIGNDMGKLPGGTLTITGNGGYSKTETIYSSNSYQSVTIPKSHADGAADINTRYILKYVPSDKDGDYKMAWYRNAVP